MEKCLFITSRKENIHYFHIARIKALTCTIRMPDLYHSYARLAQICVHPRVCLSVGARTCERALRLTPRGDAPRLTLSTFLQVLERFGLNQLLHFEIDGAAWSAGNGSSLILHLLYGGFQLVRILVAADCMHERQHARHTAHESEAQGNGV
jgi:hypothetical protein